MGRKRERRRASVGACSAALGLALAGCSAIGLGSGGPRVDLAGAWEGRIEVEGQSIRGTLELIQDGDDLEAVFDSPSFGIRADGSGEIGDAGETLEIELAYSVQCPGTARLRGRIEEDGTRLTGSVTATDCTGSMDGRFTFDRR